MGNTDLIPVILAIVVTLLGGLGGVAALLKVNAERSESLTDSAAKVVDMISEQLDEQNKRLDAFEEYIIYMDMWTDRFLDLFDRAINTLAPSDADPFLREAKTLRGERPRRKNVI